MTSIAARQKVSGRARLSRWLLPATLLTTASACSGTIEPGSVPASDAPATGSNATNGDPAGGTTTGGPAVADCTEPSPGSAPLRRLSNAEYENSVSDLLEGVSGIDDLLTGLTREFPSESESLGFRNNAELLTVQPLLAQKYMDAAEQIAALAAQSDELVPCTPDDEDPLACADGFIAEVGARFYRRPLTAGEAMRYRSMFEAALAEYDFETGVEWVLFSMLQSPQFLYRVERGRESSGNVTQPTAHEMATRLAYLFWQSTPDRQLLEAAQSSGLDAPDEVEALAREMLQDERSGRLFQYFAEWLDVDQLEAFDRDPEVFPDLSAELPSWLEQETKSLVDELLARPDGSFDELFTAPYTYVNAGLAEHYGLPIPSEEGFVKVDAPERSGVLTQALMLSHDKPYRTSIVRRGLKIRTDLLCQNVPAPPDDVPLDLEAADSEQSQRERLEQHRANPTCAGCHQLLDPIGIVFESFDAVGRFRSIDEAGAPIITQSELTGTRDADGPVANVRELGARLAQSAEARDCYITQSFRFFFGREVEAADSCSMAALKQAFSESNHSLSELLIALTQTDAFLYRPVIAEVAP